MGAGIPTLEGRAPGSQPVDPGPGPGACPGPPTQAGAALKLPRLLAQTVRHFFPHFNDWLQALPDARLQEAITYPRHFLAWWGILLYLLQLGSRRSLDFDLSADSNALANLNRLAGTRLTTRPVHDTLDYYLGHSQPEGFAKVRRHMAGRLVRMKALDSARLQGRLRLLVDGTGHLRFHKKHCDRCLVQRHQHTTVYLHQVLEAKVLGPVGLVLSVGSAFLENANDPGPGAAEQRKQDCELKAFDRLEKQLKRDFPQTRFCLSGDNEFACGRVLAVCQKNRWSYLLVFKPGRTPALYAEFQALLGACPGHRLERAADGVKRLYRWLEGLPYRDSAGRDWVFNALECQETVNGATTTFAWITDLEVNAATVEELAASGREHWCIENEGFNRQKNSGLNLEHIYSTDPEKLKAYYYLLQIAHLLLQLLEKGSLLRQLAQEYAQETAAQLFGSLKHLAKRLLDGLRYGELPADPEAVGQIRFEPWNTS
ncbi:MAG: hypothetical protein M3328_18675 [Chloroflexota bacterium]|nr:hypothetical protein [Chloroflexota bacterium]